MGKSNKARVIGKTEKKEVSACVLNDIIVRHYPRDFLQQCVNKNIDVRSSLLRLNSMKYTFSTMKSLGIKTGTSWMRFSNEVKSLRGNWFSNPDTNKLSRLMEEALDISMKIIGRFASFQEKRLGSSIGDVPNAVFFNGIKNNALFVKDWNVNDALESMKEMVKRGKATSILPKIYAAQMVCYAQEEGKISSHIKKHLHPIPIVKRMGNGTIKRRMAVLNSQAELASRLKHSDFPAFFDFGYRNPKGINNTLLRISDKLRY